MDSLITELSRPYNNAACLRALAPSKMTPYVVLEALDCLRREKYLGELWKAYELKIVTAFQKSDVNKGWAWRIEEGDETELFSTWKFNLNSSSKTYEGKWAIMHQSELAEDELQKIIENLGNPSDEMILELEKTIETVRSDVRKKIAEALHDLY